MSLIFNRNGLPRLVAPALLLLLVFAGVASAQGRDMDATVDGLLRQVMNAEEQRQALHKFRELGAEAVPRLLERLRSPDRTDRLLALIALQYAWSEQALGPLKTVLDGNDAEAREIALRALNAHLDDAAFAEIAEPLLEGRNTRMRGITFQMLELREPDPKRILHMAGNVHLLQYLAPFMMRYQDTRLAPAAMRMLSMKQDVATDALSALIAMRADDPRVQQRIVVLLRHSHPAMRDRAAEYLRHCGHVKHVAALERAIEGEEDRWAKASMVEALRMIRKREELFKHVGGRGERIDAAKTTEKYKQAMKLLNDPSTDAARTEAMRVLREAELFEPMVKQDGSDVQFDVARAMARYILINRTAGYDMSGVTVLIDQRLIGRKKRKTMLNSVVDVL
ncbi:MAG: hypothetical protein MI741_10165, partial [Rhodospirillales bacterium]|nr:hypothetical protein [Rhodospirillales bacterium]